MNMKGYKAGVSALSFVMAIAMSAGATAQSADQAAIDAAQDTGSALPAEVEEPIADADIVVTGSSIRGVAPVGSNLVSVGQDALVVRESMTRLLGEIGLTDGGDNIRAIKACLLRMANVTVVVT